MALSMLTRRVDRLEDLMAELAQNVNRLFLEMPEFKDEMCESQKGTTRSSVPFANLWPNCQTKWGRWPEIWLRPAYRAFFGRLSAALWMV